MSEDEITSGLRLSCRRVGRLYPVLLDKHGNVIDGKHRLAADANWPKMRLDRVESEEDRLVARLISNVCRRNVSAAEKSEILQELGKIYVKAGVKPGTALACKISEETGMSYRWVMKYLPEKFKDCVKSESARATRRVAEEDPKRRVISFELEEPPKGAVAIKAYGNTNFVNIMLGKQFYRQLEETARKLETTTDKLVYNAILLILKT